MQFTQTKNGRLFIIIIRPPCYGFKIIAILFLDMTSTPSIDNVISNNFSYLARQYAKLKSKGVIVFPIRVIIAIGFLYIWIPYRSCGCRRKGSRRLHVGGGGRRRSICRGRRHSRGNRRCRCLSRRVIRCVVTCGRARLAGGQHAHGSRQQQRERPRNSLFHRQYRRSFPSLKNMREEKHWVNRAFRMLPDCRTIPRT